MNAPREASSSATPQLSAMNPGICSDSMRYVRRRILSCVVSATAACARYRSISVTGASRQRNGFPEGRTKSTNTGAVASACRRCANAGYDGSSSNAAACARVCHTARRVCQDTPTETCRPHGAWGALGHCFARASRCTLYKALTQDPVKLLRSLHRRAPVLCRQAFLLPIMRDEVPNRPEERRTGYALFGRDKLDDFNNERFEFHGLLLRGYDNKEGERKGPRGCCI
ncbi:hypothetical protein EDB86DRAFT_2949322 [Lactarius hatsudake]|nr:hypothetical protein EDB86DRAFT_2949322 [Lactarius hatsudake]